MTFAGGSSVPDAPTLKGKGKEVGGQLMRHPRGVLVGPWPLGINDPHVLPLSSESEKVEGIRA